MQAILNNTFDPVALSLEENAFLVDHLGKPPKVVERIPLPPGVNAKAVMPVIEEAYALGEVEKHDHEPWTGVAALKAQCQTYLDQHAGWQALQRRAGKDFPTYPSMAEWDARGKPHLGAVGSDSGHVRTYFDADGKRQPFAIPLHDPGVRFTVPWAAKAAPAFDALIVDDEKGFLRCPLCEKTEIYEPTSQSARNTANMRMAKHLRSASTDADAHKALHTKVYG